MPKLLYTDGYEVKNIDLPQYAHGAWNWIMNEPENEDEANLYASVAAVYRVANMTADAVANMPFAVVDGGGNEIDTSDNWQNEVGFMKSPRELLRLWRLSLFMTSSAYGFMEGNQVEKNLRYIVPTTITPKVDKNDGLIGFKRTLGADSVYYPIEAERIFWMYRLDHTTELLPTKHTEFKALMNAAGVIYNSDKHVRHFFERGGIKPTMLMMKGVPNQAEREKVEKIWDKVVSGFYKYLGKVFNAEAIEPHVIGEGVDNLKDNELHKQKLEDVAIAAGIPLSLLLANSANYATADIEYRSWFNNSVIPWASWMAEQMNDLLFEPMGLRFIFKPQITDTGTAEEAERAGAYSALVASNVKPSVAAQLLGYELPTDYTEYERLDEDYYEMLTQKAMAQAVDMPEVPEPKEPQPPRDITPPDTADVPKSVDLTLDQLRELDNWQQLAFRKLKRGESMRFPWVAQDVDEATASIIRARLPRCKTEDDIKAAFDLTKSDGKSELLALAASLDRAVDVVLATKPTPKEDEDKDDFIERCIPIVLEDGTAEDNEQAVAVCNSMWEQDKEEQDA